MKTQKQRIFSILAILTMTVILTCIFAACDKTNVDDEKHTKQVPVYKGMTISDSFAGTSATVASDDNGNHYGHFKGDHNDRDDEVDQNKPFEDPNAPSIEDKANSTLDVVGAAESIYYADKNQDIFITIRLSNPDSYEILSFTLNGKKYSNYMFENGSDMENLVLKVNVGDVGGIVEYTIDAIKYVDGTDIKDVRMDGDRTVKAGVRAGDQTYVNVKNEQKTMTSISFDAQVVDLYSLIEKSGGYAKAVLYDGVNMLTKDINVGAKTNIVFDNLTPNTVYQYGVVALYDNLSGNGAKLNTLYKKAVYTDTIVLFKDIQIGKESISWGYEWNSAFINKQMSEISLWQNDEKVHDVDTGATRIDGLKSNNKYTLKATYKNLQNQDETIAIEFVTYAKAVPTVEIANVQSTQAEVSFELNVTDTDNVGTIAKIELLHGDDEPIVASDLTSRSFENLLSNNNYTVKVTYTYDLNDGVGEQQIVKTADIKTKAKAFPTVEITNVQSTQTEITFELNVTDTDNVGAITKIELLHGEDAPIVVENVARSFDHLLSNNDYTIKVTYTYDLNDGVGERQIVKMADIKTQAKVAATVEIANVQSTQTEVSFELNVTDTDNVGTIAKIELLHGEDAPIVAETSDIRAFENLLSNNEYVVRVTYTYDLNDGVGEHTVTKDLTITTLAKATPEISVVSPTKTQTSVGFEISETDADNIGAITKIELYNGNELVKTAENVDVREFTDLLSNNEYAIKVTYIYDLNDGTGSHDINAIVSFKTFADISIDSIRILNGSEVFINDVITIEVNIVNNDNVEITGFVINGQSIEPTKITTNKYRINIKALESSFNEGKSKIEIESILYDGLTVNINYSKDIFIFGNINVQSIILCNDKYEPVDYAILGQEYYLGVILNNKTGYSITKINGSSNVVQSDDKNYVFIKASFNEGFNSFALSSITYAIDKNEFVLDNLKHTLTYYCVSDSYKEIYNAEQLAGISSGHVKLMKDIDLSEVDWNPINFNGYLDGNGYKIKNLTYIKNNLTLAKYGLFNYFSGVINNLTLDNFYISVSVNANTSYGTHQLAFLICNSTNVQILNSSIINSSLEIHDNSSPNNILNIYAGAFVSEASSTILINNCYTNNINIVGNSNECIDNSSCGYICVGGFVASVSTATITIKNSYYSGKISGSKGRNVYVGGFIAYSDHSGGDILIEDCISFGSTSCVIGKYGAWCGDVTGIINRAYKLVNVYEKNKHSYSYPISNESKAYPTDLNREFFAGVLKWNAEIWDFSELDVESGKYPKLKQ